MKVPQTFSQLLDLCQKAKTDGTAAVIFGGADVTEVQYLVTELAVANVYGQDPHWAAELRAGKVSFDGTSGWQRALQEFIDMSNAGCFEPGASGTSASSAEALFAQGQGLMFAGLTNMRGVIEAADPLFTFTAHPFPAGTEPNQITTYLHLSLAPAINARSSSVIQAAAQTFINFIARPEAERLVRTDRRGPDPVRGAEGASPGLRLRLRNWLQRSRLRQRPDPELVELERLLALQQDGIGLITGQTTIDGVLNAMDAAWKQGPS